MKNVLAFLGDLRLNNNREWFEANKERYKAAKTTFDTMTESLILGMGEVDPDVRGLELKDCTYRIYRDVRFSSNKDPYKTYFGAYICKGGKKSGFAGYYFHVEPEGEGGMFGSSFMSSGIYLPQPAELKSIRQDIIDRGDEFEKLIAAAKGFRLSEGSKLKRGPAGFPADSPYAEYLKLKDIYLEKHVGDKFITSAGLPQRVVAAFEVTVGLNHFLNRAIEYARENQ